MILNLRDSIITEEFDYNLLKHSLSLYKHPRVKINDLIKKGNIIRVKKGLYVFGSRWAKELYCKEILANLIYGPSYLSLEYALYFYGLIPEKVEVLTSVTNKRKKIFQTPIGMFSYQYINPLLYYLGVTLYQIDKNHTIFIATKEKALVDKLYFEKELLNCMQMREYLFENLRMDEHELKKISLKKVKILANLYKKNAQLLVQVLEKI